MIKEIKAAKLIDDTLRIPNDCFDKWHTIVRTAQIVVVGDDVIAAMHAADLFFRLRKCYGNVPRILCVGGQSWLNRHVYHKTDAELQALVLQRLEVPQEKIVVLPAESSLADCVCAVVNATISGGVTLWCVPRRYGFAVERTVAKLAPRLNSRWYSVYQSPRAVMKLYNGRKLCHGQLLMHDWAAILYHSDVAVGISQKPPRYLVAPEVVAAAMLLEDKFRLHLPCHNLRTWGQKVQLRLAILLHRRAIRRDFEREVSNFAAKLQWYR